MKGFIQRIYQYMPFNSSTLKVAGGVMLLVLAMESCSTLFHGGPPVQFVDRITITDPVAYRKAVQMAGQANRIAASGNYGRALQMAEQSLKIHESFDAFYVQGLCNFRLNKIDAALESFLKAESIRPEDQQLLMTMAVVYLAKGDAEMAMERYRHLHETYPREPVYAFKVGTTYKLLGDYEKAYEYLKKADVKGYEALDQVYLQLGDTSLELKEYEESEDYFRKAKELNPKLDVESLGGINSRVAKLLEEGNDLIKDEKYNEALEKFNEAMKVSPSSAGPRLLAGTVYMIIGKYPDAIVQFKKAVELNPRNPQGYSLLGSAYYKKKDYVSALKVFRAGLQLSPEDYELCNKQGLVYRDSGELRSAIDSFHRSVKIKPDYIAGRLNLAYAYIDDRRYVDAARNFQQVLEKESGNEEAEKGLKLIKIYNILDKGDRFLQAGRAPEAIKLYNSALSVESDIPLIHSAIGRGYFASKNYKKAEASFLKALELDKENIPAMQGLIRVYSTMGQKAKQRGMLSRLQNLTRNNVIAAITVGRLLEDDGKLNEALEYYGRMARSYKGNEAIRGRLGYVYYKLGMKENDSRDYGKALGYFTKAKQYNSSIPMIDETLRIVQENRRFSSLIPELEKGDALMRKKDYSAALQVFENINTRMKRPSILVKMAECNIAMGQEEKGISMLENAHVSSPQDVEIGEAISNYMLKKGETDRARKGFEEIIARKENAYYSHYKLGVIYMRENSYDKAIEAFTRALIYRPDFTVANVARGVAFYESGKKELARQEFEEALRKQDRTPLPEYNIGILLYNDKMEDKAEEVFQSLLEAHPDFSDARYQLSYIYYNNGELGKAEQEIEKAIESEGQDIYYYARTQIYEKEYEKQPIPANAAKLKDAYTEMLTRFPDSRYAKESREKLQKTNPDMRILQPYPIPEGLSSRPLMAGGDLIYVNKNTIRAIDSSAKKIRWQTDLGKPVKDLVADQALYVLVPGKVLVMDTLDGVVINEIQVDRTTDHLIGSFNRIGAISLKGGAEELTLYDAMGKKIASRKADRAHKFVSAGPFFYIVPRSSVNYKIQKLNGELQDERMPAPVENVDDNLEYLAQGDMLYIVTPGRALTGIDTDEMQAVFTTPLEGNLDRVLLWNEGDDHGLLVSDGQRVIVLDRLGKKVTDVPLAKPAFTPESVYRMRENQIIYIDQENTTRMVDATGNEVWSVKIPSTPALEGEGEGQQSAYTLYY